MASHQAGLSCASETGRMKFRHLLCSAAVLCLSGAMQLHVTVQADRLLLLLRCSQVPQYEAGSHSDWQFCGTGMWFMGVGMLCS